MYLLSKIDNYIKSNNLMSRKVYLPVDYFDDYINEAIIYVVRELDEENKFSFGDSNYCLNFNDKDTIFINASTDGWKHNLIICEEPNIMPKIGHALFISEKTILEYATFLKQNRVKQLELRDLLTIKYPDMDRLERLKIEYKIFHKMMKDKITEYHNNGIDILKDEEYLNLGNSYNKILQSVLENEKELISILNERSKSINLVFSPGFDEIGSRVSTCKSGVGSKQERINEIIPIADRQNILKSHKYIYWCKAYSSLESSTNYICYMFKIKYQKYILVLEPVNGTSYTKIISVNAKWINEEYFISLVKNYLELSLKESLKEENIVRTGHTRIDTFKDVIDFTVCDKCDKPINNYTRKRINNIKNS